MANLQQNFSFAYPLKEIITNVSGLRTTHHGDLIIEGVAYYYPEVKSLDISQCYSFDIDYIKKDGTDIKEALLFLIDPIKLDDLSTAIIHHIADSLFKDDFPPVAIEPPVRTSQNTKLEDLKAWIRADAPAGKAIELPEIEVQDDVTGYDCVIDGILLTPHDTVYVCVGGDAWPPLKETDTLRITRLWQCLCHKSEGAAI